MFRGWFEHSINGKGRVSIPAVFRDALGAQDADRVIVTTNVVARSLVVYPLSTWAEFEQRLRQAPQFDEKVQRFRRIYVAGAMECAIDKLGRIVLPARLREQAGIEAEVVFAGDIEKFQIWARSEWELVRQADLEQLDDVSRTLANLGF